MSDATVQIVREFFEFNAFHVMTHWQHDAVRFRGTEHGIQLYVENSAPASERPIDFLLRSGDIAGISRALVEVRGWHTERFYASVFESNPVLSEVAGEAARARARQVFGRDDVKSILVISELPALPEPRQRAIEAARERGLDHVIEFPTILQEILEKLNPHVSYAPSITLQTIRLLKRYEFLRVQQLEFPFSAEAPAGATPVHIETAEDPTLELPFADEDE